MTLNKHYIPAICLGLSLTTSALGLTLITDTSAQPRKEEVTHCGFFYKDIKNLGAVWTKYTVPVMRDIVGDIYCSSPINLPFSQYQFQATFIKGTTDTAGNVTVLVESAKSNPIIGSVAPAKPLNLRIIP